ncbi:putative ABC transporter ATP-binding protein YknY [bioreactor metagenome]|uniref:Putative ABC transporter ATP-binding protein YknY n=1 Tax=bioreactor metagenome TaxID=1076179 RepID=A0A645BRD6_9ZZZZ|nr:ABC transporter ATP-binding protein [Erysipelotrichaceae bacterium]
MSNILNQEPLIRMNGIIKRYFEGKENELEILHGIDIDIYPGQFVAIVGESGSGKSTLMNLIGALDRPSAGEYYLNSVNVGKASDKELSVIRNRRIGFVFQNFDLIGKINAIKNVELPMLYAGTSRKESFERAKVLLDKVGMNDRIKHLPNELSGGQKQRIAIARAMANNPDILLADEPTGALDSQTSRTVMDIFHRLNHEEGMTIVLITHNNSLAEECDRILEIYDGKIIKERKGKLINEHLG